MNVNGSRFHLLLGEADWGRCQVERNGGNLPLDAWWDEVGQGAGDNGEGIADTGPLEPAPFSWDGPRNELRLQRRPIALPPTPEEVPFSLNARRSADADANGNLYWIDGERRRLRVRSVGSGRESAFWPPAAGGCGQAGDLDAESCPQPVLWVPATLNDDAPMEYLALAVTEEHQLVAAYRQGVAVGLLVFDLAAGGPPLNLVWPSGSALSPFAMAARPGGGVWVLDREAGQLWELDRRLTFIERPSLQTEIAPLLFQPTSGLTRERPTPRGPLGIDLLDPEFAAVAEPISDPIAIAPQSATAVLILDRNDAGGVSRVYRLVLRSGLWRAEGPIQLQELAHDMVLADARAWGGASSRLLVTTASGNQALAFAPGPEDEPLRLRGAVELYPLRRHHGRALVAVKGQAWYDSGAEQLRWVPVVEQPRVRLRESAELTTPVFDGREPQCVWDRLMIDACIGADTRVEVWSRASDECLDPGTDAAAPIAPWLPQPLPRLRDDSELPWLRASARQPSRRAGGSGTWELLLQGQRGRWLQLRLRLSGNGSASPRLRALRAWYPRFSYPRRFLPGVYSEEPVQADFLERFLAIMEQVNTQIEDRIVQVQALMDPRAAPAEALDWLAGWMDLALDPGWDERRRRLLIGHALEFFRWRGTTHGLRMALALALEPCVDETLFAEPATDAAAATHPATGVRVVEAYQARLLGGVAAGDSGTRQTDTPAPAELARGTLWTPAEGNAGLAQRLARCIGSEVTDDALLRPVPLFLDPPAGSPAETTAQAVGRADWSRCLAEQLGFIPTLGSAERLRWRCFLADRYATSAALVAAHGHAEQALFQCQSGGTDVAIDLPADWPGNATRAEDWQAYCALAEPTRVRWQQFLARRWRRIERLNAAWQSRWPTFGLIPLPDHLPVTASAQQDWLQFEGVVMPMARGAHRFSVLLPVTSVNEDPAELRRRMGIAERITALEKPAHTIFDVRLYWSLNRLGAARLGLDTLLDAGSRAKALIPDAVLGRAYLGAGFVGTASPSADPARRPLAC
jgi:phage tail-like protein